MVFHSADIGIDIRKRQNSTLILDGIDTILEPENIVRRTRIARVIAIAEYYNCGRCYRMCGVTLGVLACLDTTKCERSGIDHADIAAT